MSTCHVCKQSAPPDLACAWCDQNICGTHLAVVGHPTSATFAACCSQCAPVVLLLSTQYIGLDQPYKLQALVHDGYLLRATLHPAYTTRRFVELLEELAVAERFARLTR